MADDFVLVDRDALVDELIRRSSRTVGDNATLSSGEDHVAWLDAERKRGWTYWPVSYTHLDVYKRQFFLPENDYPFAPGTLRDV